MLVFVKRVFQVIAILAAMVLVAGLDSLPRLIWG